MKRLKIVFIGMAVAIIVYSFTTSSSPLAPIHGQWVMASAKMREGTTAPTPLEATFTVDIYKKEYSFTRRFEGSPGQEFLAGAKIITDGDKKTVGVRHIDAPIWGEISFYTFSMPWGTTQFSLEDDGTLVWPIEGGSIYLKKK